MGALFGGDDHATHDVAYLWPCNVQTWQHWLNVQTQWRVGMSGATGLDYASVAVYLSACGLSDDERNTTFHGIRAAEAGTLAGWAYRRQQDATD